MKKLICVFLSLVFVFSLCSCAKNETTQQTNAVHQSAVDDNTGISIISYNVAGPWGNLLKGTHYSVRIKLFAKQMKEYYPDSIGTQETNVYWLEHLKALLPEYESYSVLRGGDGDGNNAEMNAILYLKDKYNQIDCGTFWLTATPDEMSKFEGAGCYRICSWVLLENIRTGYRYIHMNTHLDNASEEATQYGAEVILGRYQEIIEKYPNVPVVLTGDFNQTTDSGTYSILNNSDFDDTRTLTDNTNHESTYNAWNKDATGQEPIDFIFVSNDSFGVNSFSMLPKTYNNKLVSDHFGIMAELEITQ